MIKNILTNSKFNFSNHKQFFINFNGGSYLNKFLTVKNLSMILKAFVKI